MAQNTAPFPLGPGSKQQGGWSWQGGDAVQGEAGPAAQPQSRPTCQVPPSHVMSVHPIPFSSAATRRQESPQDGGIPQALSNGVMEVPPCSPLSPLPSAAAEHQLGSERGELLSGRGNRGPCAVPASCRWREGVIGSFWMAHRFFWAQSCRPSAWGWAPWLPWRTKRGKNSKKNPQVATCFLGCVWRTQHIGGVQ